MNAEQTKNYEELVKCMENFGSKYDMDLIRKAYEWCVKAHEGQKRRSSEDYYIHPFNVAKIIVSPFSFTALVIAATTLIVFILLFLLLTEYYSASNEANHP